MVPDKVETPIKGCSACGKDHTIEFKRTEPTTIDGQTFGYVGTCEETGTQVYMTYNHKKEAVCG